MRFSRHCSVILAGLGGLAVFLLPLPIQAATFHVSPQGSDTPPYSTYATAAHNVADAVEATSGPGDTVLIHAGEYDIDTTIDLTNGVTLAGIDRDSVSLVWHKLPGMAYNWMFYLLGDNEILGIEFVNPLGTSIDPYSESMLMDHVNGLGPLDVHDCRFDQLGMSVQSLWDIRIYDNEFLVWSGTGINTSVGAEKLFIYDNWFFGGIGASSGTGILLTEGDALIERNVFDFSQTGMRGDPIVVDRFPQKVVLRNNLIIGGQTPMIWTWTTGLVENNTIIGPNNVYDDLTVALSVNDTLVFRNNVFLDFLGGPLITYSPSGPISMLRNSFWPPTNSYVRVKASIDSSLLDIRDSANFSAYPMFADGNTDELSWT